MKKFRLEGDPHEAEMVECEFGEFVKLEDVEEEIKALAKDNLEHEGGCDPVVYLAEGSQIGYLPEGPTEALGW